MKSNPFEVGEEVSIFPLNATGIVVKQLFPHLTKGQMRYVVEFTQEGKQRTEEFHSSRLGAVREG